MFKFPPFWWKVLLRQPCVVCRRPVADLLNWPVCVCAPPLYLNIFLSVFNNCEQVFCCNVELSHGQIALCCICCLPASVSDAIMLLSCHYLMQPGVSCSHLFLICCVRVCLLTGVQDQLGEGTFLLAQFLGFWGFEVIDMVIDISFLNFEPQSNSHRWAAKTGCLALLLSRSVLHSYGKYIFSLLFSIFNLFLGT